MEDTTTAVPVADSRRVGFRSIQFVNKQFEPRTNISRGYTGEPRLFFAVNNQPIFARGANFVTVDVSAPLLVNRARRDPFASSFEHERNGCTGGGEPRHDGALQATA